MKIEIETNGSTQQTVVLINGRPVENLVEFHFSMNPTRFHKHGSTQGKCKMQVGCRGNFMSYYGDDFKKYDESVSLEDLNT